MDNPNLTETVFIKNPDRVENNQLQEYPYIPEYVRLGLSPIMADVPSEMKQENSNFTEKKNKMPNVGEFVLMVRGKIIATGSNDLILNQAKKILYGEHKDFVGAELQPDDLVVLKRLSLKVGVFIDG